MTGIDSALTRIAGNNLERVNGWLMPFRAFGERSVMQGRYLQRAISADVGIYGNDDEEAFYPVTFLDANDGQLNATKKRYKLTFVEGQLPPINESGFWSLSMYDALSQQFIENDIDRYAIGDRTDGLMYDDGALTIHIQRDEPSEGEYGQANWLPAPSASLDEKITGLFYLVLRIYLPQESVFNGEWEPPQIQIKD